MPEIWLGQDEEREMVESVQLKRLPIQKFAQPGWVKSAYPGSGGSGEVISWPLQPAPVGRLLRARPRCLCH